MDLALAGASVALAPNDTQMGGISIELAAFDGEVAYGQFPVDDPAGTLSVFDGRSALVTEGSTVVVDGFIIDQDRERAGEPGGDAVQNALSIADPNALLDGFRVVRSRGSETDVARVLAFAALDVPSFDTTWVLVADTVTLPAKAYSSDGGWTAELIPDLVESTGKTLFVHDKAAGGRCLHYHTLTSGHDCGLTIDDTVIPQVGTTYNPSFDTRRQRTSIDLRNDVKGVDQAGRTSTATDATSIANHDTDGLQHQALVTFETVSQGDLDVKTAAYLASNKNDYTTWTVSIGPLDEDALALIRVGDLITCTSTVMALTASPQRIAHMTLTPWTGKDGPRPAASLWEATLELGAPVRRRRRGRAAKVIGPPPVTPFVCTPTDYTVPASGSGGPWYAILSDPEFSGMQSADSAGPGGNGLGILHGGCVYAYNPMLVFHSPDAGWLNNVGVRSHFGGKTGGFGVNMGDYAAPEVIAEGTFTVTDGSDDYVANIDAVNDIEHNSYGSSVSVHVKYVSGPDPRFIDLPPCSNGAPVGGQPVHDVTTAGDGTTTVYSSQFPYRPGTLAVWVNGLDWSAEVTEDDPTTGDYTLAYPPPLGATVWVRYLAAP